MTTERDGESGSGAQGDGAGVALASWQHGRAARRRTGWRCSSPVRQRRLGELDEGVGVWRAGGGTGGCGASRRSRRQRFKPSTAAALQVEHGGGAFGVKGRAGDDPVRSVSGGWENLTKGDGVWRAGGGTGGSGASRRSWRRRFKPSTAAALQVEHGGGASRHPLFSSSFPRDS